MSCCALGPTSAQSGKWAASLRGCLTQRSQVHRLYSGMHLLGEAAAVKAVRCTHLSQWAQQ